MLDVFEALGAEDALKGWDGLGLAVQAYQKRALPVIAWLTDLAHRQRRMIPVRLVKGAYWDSEIKRGQELGLPIIGFARKVGPTPRISPARAPCSRAAPDLSAVRDAQRPHAGRTEILAHLLEPRVQRLHGMGGRHELNDG
jgi:RHH-type proline utilization regulon transcriptional repressor/proline dehydrogenase/delta 1-pyrroline-5-carboxylate dehydrogenase